MIKSVFNLEDTNPSMSIYLWRGEYKYNDFSSGNKGSAIDFVMKYHNIPYIVAASMIEQDYKEFLASGELEQPEIKEKVAFKVTEYLTRKWNVRDRDYWRSYEVGSKILTWLGVTPLESYKLDNGSNCIVMGGNCVYGYFNKAGALYKIYQPLTGKKFIKLFSHVQGLDQLEFKSDTLIITKALKDIAALYELELGPEYIAPDSESTMLSDKLLKELIPKYKHVFTLFDYDPAGEKATQKYKDKYSIEGIPLNMQKDTTDSIRAHGGENVKKKLKLLLNERTS